MTPQDHNKVIGIMHLIWGGFNTLVVLIIYPLILGIMLPIFRSDPNAPPEVVSIFTAIMVAVFVLSLLLSLHTSTLLHGRDVLGLTRLREPIRVKRSGSVKGVEDGQDRQTVFA